MHPVLIELGPISLYSYGFFIAAAFLLGMAWTMREAGNKGLDSRYVQNLGFYVILGGLAGARLSYVAAYQDVFSGDPLGVLKFWKGGLLFWGGAVLAALLMVLYLYRKRQRVLSWLDAASPGTALGLSVGWIGCLVSGCGYGKPSDLAWSIMPTHPDAIGPLFVSLHPVQAYHAVVALFCFFMLLILKNRVSVQGRLAGIFLISYPIMRIIVDFWRGDLQPEFWVMNISQVIGLGIVAIGIFLYRPLTSGN
ncbi:MAG: prolipoprotein diacylglyceryl transferase [Desulfonatronovibrio sp. MSAO_Bac4]|nr:MAG: prolipoprotein diacylglyceryl transferase [Desulfonatronovibrio sp. MSAO_Bac4]